MAQYLKLVDVVVELADARIPRSSRNPEVDRIIGQKPRVLLLNKSDFADEAQTRRWLDYYQQRGTKALAADCRSGRGLNALMPGVREVLAEKIARWEQSGMTGRPIRMMIVGIPNVGKSSLINRLAGGRRARVEDRPGVTRGKQWVKINDGMELLDMPGVLWPKFEDRAVGENLAFTGAVRDQIMDTEALASRLLERLAADYPALLRARYSLEPEELQGQPGHALLALIGKKRGMLLPGGEINTERAAIAVLDEFRGGQIGTITLEAPKA